MRAAILALGCAFVLGGCASDKLTVFANEDSVGSGAVAIIDEVTGEDKAVVDKELTEAKLGKRPKPRAVRQLKPAYTELLKNLPPKAESFTITFGSDETSIPLAQIGTLDKIRQALENRPGAQIEVVGFTDSDGTPAYNDGVSLERARGVLAELRASGFPVDTEDAVGRGERAALADGGPDEVVNELFRKVVIVIS